MNRLLLSRASAVLLRRPHHRLGFSQLPSSQLLLQRYATVDAQSSIGSSESSQSEGDSEAQQSFKDIRSSILRSALEEVHQYGWTEDALAAATSKASSTHNPHVSMSVMGMITVDDLIGFCMDQWNIQLKEDLNNQQELSNSTPYPTDPLERGLKTRLEYLTPYLRSNRWHEGMALGIRGPSNALQTQRQLQEMVDIVVESSGNVSLGAPEKMALGAVYVATELHLLKDQSPDYQDTWDFLSSRMEDWRRLTSLTSSVGLSTGKGGLNESVFVATSVASSLVGGLVSLIANPSKGMPMSFGLPEGVWTALFQNQQGNWQQQGHHDDRHTTTPVREQDGTHPDDYNVPKSSTSNAKK